MGGYIRLLITVSICCCVMGFLMWLFLKCYKKASIWILLLCTGLLLVRFLYPHEFSFTHTIGVTIGYPTINDFFNLSFMLGRFHFTIAHIIIGIWIIGIIVSAVHLLYHYCRLHMIIRRFPVRRIRLFFHNLIVFWKKGIFHAPDSVSEKAGRSVLLL